jgi:hypothetical protein
MFHRVPTKPWPSWESHATKQSFQTTPSLSESAFSIVLLSNMLISTAQSVFTRVAFGANRPSVKSNFCAVTDRLMEGQVVAMDRFKGDVLVVVNVASK